jgi:Mg2+/Co2+ transporter CorB
MLFGIIGIIILLFCSAMVSASEVALFSLNQTDLDKLNKTNSSKSSVINQLLSTF